MAKKKYLKSYVMRIETCIFFLKHLLSQRYLFQMFDEIDYLCLERMKLTLPLSFISKSVFSFLVDFIKSNIVSSLRNTQMSQKHKNICIFNCTFSCTVIQVIKTPKENHDNRPSCLILNDHFQIKHSASQNGGSL